MSENFSLVGTKIGGYELTSGICETANSIVYESSADCRKLAIKFMKKNATSKDQYINEVLINKSITCDYIMPIEKVITHVPKEFHCGIVMRKAIGCDLLDMLLGNNGPLPESIAVQIAFAGLNALKYLHEKDIVHRDIKMENFFLMDENQTELDIVLADFGHACQIQPGEKMNTFYIGTLEYSAPEILNNIEYDKSVDIWSFGCLMYSILAYRTPFGQPENDSFECRAEFIKRVSREPDYTIFPWNNVSEEAKDFVKSMIKIDPNERASIDSLLQHQWMSTYRADYGRQKARRERSESGIISESEKYTDIIQDAG